MSASLKPCPFCGGDARVAAMSFDEYSAEVGCGQPDCHAVAFVACDTEAEGIAAWNRRSDPSREAMREALEAFARIPVERFKGGNGPGGEPEDVFHAWNLGETEVELKVKHVLAARAALALDGDAK